MPGMRNLIYFASRVSVDRRANLAKGKPSESPYTFSGFRSLLRWVFRAVFGLGLGGVSGLFALLVLYYIITGIALRFFYEAGEAAGPASVYIPGMGFPGFWFHFGYLHSFGSQRDLHDYDYYCFSAGCLSILPVFLNRSLDDVYDIALKSQNAWKNGSRSRFEIVEYFFDEMYPPDEDTDVVGGRYMTSRSLDVENNNNTSCASEVSEPHGHPSFLPRLKILVTTPSNGFEVLESGNRNELKENMIRTTWVPYLTGWGFSLPAMTEGQDSNDSRRASASSIYLDGAFSRVLHPRCEVEWNVPLMWETFIYTFSPDLSRDEVQQLWNKGRIHEYPLPRFPPQIPLNSTNY